MGRGLRLETMDRFPPSPKPYFRAWRYTPPHRTHNRMAQLKWTFGRPSALPKQHKAIRHQSQHPDCAPDFLNGSNLHEWRKVIRSVVPKIGHDFRGAAATPVIVENAKAAVVVFVRRTALGT